VCWGRIWTDLIQIVDIRLRLDLSCPEVFDAFQVIVCVKRGSQRVVNHLLRLSIPVGDLRQGIAAEADSTVVVAVAWGLAAGMMSGGVISRPPWFSRLI